MAVSSPVRAGTPAAAAFSPSSRLARLLAQNPPALMTFPFPRQWPSLQSTPGDREREGDGTFGGIAGSNDSSKGPEGARTATRLGTILIGTSHKWHLRCS